MWWHARGATKQECQIGGKREKGLGPNGEQQSQRDAAAKASKVLLRTAHARRAPRLAA